MLAKKPPPGGTPTCDTVGVLGAAVNVVASLEVVQALKVLTGQVELNPPLIFVDVWEGVWEALSLRRGERRCPACDEGRFDFLTAREADQVVELCGENAFQITPRGDGHIPLERLAERLRRVGEVFRNEYLLRFRAGPCEITLFADGRALVRGATDEAEARGVYAKYVGA